MARLAIGRSGLGGAHLGVPFQQGLRAGTMLLNDAMLVSHDAVGVGALGVDLAVLALDTRLPVQARLDLVGDFRQCTRLGLGLLGSGDIGRLLGAQKIVSVLLGLQNLLPARAPSQRDSDHQGQEAGQSFAAPPAGCGRH